MYPDTYQYMSTLKREQKFHEEWTLFRKILETGDRIELFVNSFISPSDEMNFWLVKTFSNISFHMKTIFV